MRRAEMHQRGQGRGDLDEPEDQPEGSDTEDGKPSGYQQAKPGCVSMDAAQPRQIPAPIVLGEQHGDSGARTDQQEQEEIHHGRRDADRGEAALIGVVADDHAVDGVVELLKNVACDQGQHQLRQLSVLSVHILFAAFFVICFSVLLIMVY